MSAHAIGRDEIDQLAEAGDFNAEQREIALVVAGVSPNDAQWNQFLGRVFLTFGVTLLIAAVGYFVAYNWDAMGRFAKIALLEVGVAGATMGAAYFVPGDIRSRAALLAAVLLTGPLLAFIGQTYQTGADTYELFRAWALLALPWVVVARWRVLWCFWLLVANVAVALYFAEIRWSLISAVLFQHGALAHLAGNGLFLVAIEWLGRDRLTGGGRSVERLALALVIGSATFLYLHLLFDSGARSFWALPLSIAVFGAVWWWYRLKQLDLVALAMWSFAGIAVTVATVGRMLSEVFAGGLAFLVIGGTVIGLSAWAASWLRGLHKAAEVL